MSVDVAAIRLFLQTWKPVIDCLPALIDSVEHQADLDRAVAFRRNELDEVQAQVQAAKDSLAGVKRSIKEQEAAGAEAKKQRLAAVSLEEDAAKEEIKALKLQIKTLKASSEEIRSGLENEGRAQAQVLLNAAKEEADKVNAEAAALREEIANLTKQRDQIERTLSQLRAKLGV